MEHTRSLWCTWIGLLLLMALSAASAFLPLGWGNTALGLGIAMVKGSMVALVFMRLRAAGWLLRLAALAGLCTLALLFALSATDYATRPVQPAPWQRPGVVAPRLGQPAHGALVKAFRPAGSSPAPGAPPRPASRLASGRP